MQPILSRSKSIIISDFMKPNFAINLHHTPDNRAMKSAQPPLKLADKSADRLNVTTMRDRCMKPAEVDMKPGVAAERGPKIPWPTHVLLALAVALLALT